MKYILVLLYDTNTCIVYRSQKVSARSNLLEQALKASFFLFFILLLFFVFLALFLLLALVPRAFLSHKGRTAGQGLTDDGGGGLFFFLYWRNSYNWLSLLICSTRSTFTLSHTKYMYLLVFPKYHISYTYTRNCPSLLCQTYYSLHH